MDKAALEIRKKLKKMPPKSAIEYVKSFELPEEEELFIIECDIRKKSIVALSMQNAVSTVTVSRRRQDGYAKMTWDKLHTLQ